MKVMSRYLSYNQILNAWISSFACTGSLFFSDNWRSLLPPLHGLIRDPSVSFMRAVSGYLSYNYILNAWIKFICMYRVIIFSDNCSSLLPPLHGLILDPPVSFMRVMSRYLSYNQICNAWIKFIFMYRVIIFF